MCEKHKLGDICDILNGRNQKKVEDINGKYPIYGSGGIMGYANDYICKAGTTIIGRKGSINKPLYVDTEFWNVDTAFGLQPKECCHSRFLYYLCKSIDFTRYDKGVTIPSLVKSDLLQIPISIPSLEEQNRIVEELDLLSNIIEKKRQQLSELDNLAQSIFYDMFGDPVTNEKGWEVKTIEEVCLDIIRGPFGSALKKEYFVPKGLDTYKVYEQKHAIQKDVSLGAYYISSDRYQSMMRFTVYENDIIMSCSGTIGEMFIIPHNAEVGIINQALLLFRLSNVVDKTFFMNVMNAVKSSMETRGAGIQNIGSVKYIKQIGVACPPLSLQQLFAQKIETIEKQKALIKVSIAETEELFNSRMDYYFS